MVAMVVMVFCSVPEHEPHFPVEPQHSGYCQKALVSSKTILELYWGEDVEIKRNKEKWETNICPLRRNANYLRKKSGAYAPLVLMPHYLR